MTGTPVERARFGAKPPVEGSDGAVVTSHPLATRAGADALREGGSAVDAALAAAAAQLVVEPHMTSLTGGLSLLHRAADGEAGYVNGNVAAPAAPLPGFTGADLTTGRGVPVPGWWPAFREAHERLGRLPLHRILEPAIAIAEEGFEIGPYLWGELYANRASIGVHAEGREAYFADGALLEPGAALRQPRMARTLRRLAEEGDDYYLGDFARAVAAEARRGGGVVAASDLAANRAVQSAPLTGGYRGAEVVASAPPDDGGAMLHEALALLEGFDLASMGAAESSPDTLELLVDVHEEVYYAPPRRSRDEALRRLEPDAVRERAGRLGGRSPGPSAAPPSPGTIHVSVLDAEGNAASLTHSHMASPWVNGLFAEGFQLSGGGSFFQRGMPWPGEKAAVYLAPTIVVRDGAPVVVCGSPSVSLVACVLQGLVRILDFGEPIERAVALPRFGVRPHEPAAGWLPGVTLEHGFDAGVAREFERRSRARGRWTRGLGPWHSLTGNFEAVTRDAATGFARSCADPRRNGAAEAV